MTESETDLFDMRALQSGEESALDRLIARHKNALFGFIRGYVGNEEDASELLADTFVRVFLKRDRFDCTGKFKAWLYCIAKNLCRDHCRKQRSWRQRVQDWMPVLFVPNGTSDQVVADSCRNPAEETVAREVLSGVEQAIAKLPPDLRAALILYAIEERSQAECAELLGVSVKAVETRVYRARRMLAATLERQERSEAVLPTPLPQPIR